MTKKPGMLQPIGSQRVGYDLATEQQLYIKASLVAQWLKKKKTCLAIQEPQETQIQSVVQEDILEKEMATHSSIPAWEIPWTEEPGGLQSMGLQRVRHD